MDMLQQFRPLERPAITSDKMLIFKPHVRAVNRRRGDAHFRDVMCISWRFPTPRGLLDPTTCTFERVINNLVVLLLDRRALGEVECSRRRLLLSCRRYMQYSTNIPMYISGPALDEYDASTTAAL